MDLAPNLKILTAPHDALRKGLPSAVADVSAPLHPIDELQRNREQLAQEARTRELTAQYGLAAAMKYNADHYLLKQFHRFPGLPSSFLGLNVLKGTDMELNPEDWLGDQELSAQYFADFHSTMEHKLKM